MSSRMSKFSLMKFLETIVLGKQNQFKWYHYAIGGIVWFGAISAVTSLLTRNKYYNK